MTIQQVAGVLQSLRRAQEVADANNDVAAASGSPTTVDMSFLSNATNYVDDRGIGHVKVNDNMDWSGILPNDSTVHIVYEGSGSTEEIIIIPAGQNALDTTESSFSSSNSMSDNSSTSTPTGSSDDSSSRDSVGVIGTGSNSVILVIVGTALALIAIVSVLAVAVYSRRNRRRAYSEDPSNTDEPFIVGSLPDQPVPQLSLLDTDMSPDLWLEGQYQYSPNMSRLMNSLNGTAILSDNSTTPMHHRLTVDAYPSSRRGHRRNGGLDHTEYGNDMRGNSGRDNGGSHVHGGSRVHGGSHVHGGSRVHGGRHESVARRDRSALDDISDRGRRRTGTTPIVLYDENSTEEHKSNSSRTQHRPRPSLSFQQQRQHHQEQQQQRRRDKYATRRDR